MQVCTQQLLVRPQETSPKRKQKPQRREKLRSRDFIAHLLKKAAREEEVRHICLRLWIIGKLILSLFMVIGRYKVKSKFDIKQAEEQ